VRTVTNHTLHASCDRLTAYQALTTNLHCHFCYSCCYSCRMRRVAGRILVLVLKLLLVQVS